MRADVAEVRMLLASPDARVRALAARSACPCHGTFELLHELRDELTLLAETDPDKKVRGAGWHTLREAIELNVARRRSCPASATARCAGQTGTASGPCAVT
jgi:hypothetical protein